MHAGSLTVDEFLDRIGAKTPAPGGGAVTGAVGAIAAALGLMVVNYSTGRPSLEEHADDLDSSLGALDKARHVLLLLAEEDAQAYQAVNALMKLDKGDPRRKAEMPEAARAAVGVPMSVIATLCDVLRILEDLCGKTNPHLVSDLAIAGVLAEGAARASIWNVRINLGLLDECGIETVCVGEAEAMLEDAAARCAAIEKMCAE